MTGTDEHKLTVWHFIWKYVVQAKYLLIGFFVVFIVSAFVSRGQNYIIAEMIGVLSEANKYQNVARTLLCYLGFMILALFAGEAIDFIRHKMEIRFRPFIMLKVSKDLFVMTHKHSARFFEENLSGNISGKAHNIINSIDRLCGEVLFGFSRPIIDIVMSLCFIAFANVKLALILGLMNVFLLLVSAYIRKYLTFYSKIKAKFNSAANGIFVDGVTNSQLVKSFANYFYEKRLYFKAARKAAEAQYLEMNKELTIRSVSKFIFDFMIIVFYALIFYFWYKYDLSIANVVLSTSLIMTMVNAVERISFVVTSVAQVYGSIQDGLDLLALPNEVLDKPDARILKVAESKIDYNKITYHYKNGMPLFKNFSLHIAPKEKVGLIGRSGSGKSTLIKLLGCHYNLQKGKILISGVDITDVTQESLRKNIAVIPQESTLFNRSIMENIRYGNPKATDKQVIAAAKKAYIHDFIVALPNGYESKVGERGVMLSGGERQRIAIARAILKNAPILILDEATSALDSESERFIQRSLKNLMKGKTVIAIAHRLSTLKEMDRLVVMNKGKIVETGKHRELLEKKGAYYKFYKLQATGFKR